MKMTGAQILLESLVREGVEVIFGFPGGKVIPLYDTLPQYPQLRHILVRHEQGPPQERDITGIPLPITKHNYLVLDVNQVAATIKEAFYLARTGRPGPILI